jgi:hypothetical protein
VGQKICLENYFRAKEKQKLNAETFLTMKNKIIKDFGKI